MECRMDHIVLNVDDMDKMITFYSEVLMLPTERLEEYQLGRVPFPSIRLNADTIIDLFPKTLWQQSIREQVGTGRLNHFCMNMGKPLWDKLIKQLEDAQIPIEEGPVKRWGAHGTGISIYFRDPEGCLIEARYYV